jgi:hypothetical protein
MDFRFHHEFPKLKRYDICGWFVGKTELTLLISMEIIYGDPAAACKLDKNLESSLLQRSTTMKFKWGHCSAIKLTCAYA